MIDRGADMESTRGRVLLLLRRGTKSIAELAESLGISANAVRMHVTALQRDGLVEYGGTSRSTGGKPAQLYEITARAEELFPKAYAFVLGELIGYLRDREGGAGAERVMREVAARATAGVRGRGGDLEARVGAAADVIRELGSDVEVERVETGWFLRGAGCPLSAVVSDHAVLCTLVQAVIEEITERPVRICCRREGRPRCAFHVESAAGGAVPPG
jgi:predicted ArsR family transcriptional regulator